MLLVTYKPVAEALTGPPREVEKKEMSYVEETMTAGVSEIGPLTAFMKLGLS